MEVYSQTASKDPVEMDRAAADSEQDAACTSRAQAHDASNSEPTSKGVAQNGGSMAGGVSMDKLEKLMQRYDSNAMPRCGWLDVLAFRRIDQLNQVRIHHCFPARSVLPMPTLCLIYICLSDHLCMYLRTSGRTQAMGQGSTRPVMMVEMERWDRCVMYGVKSYSVVPPAATWSVADAELCCDSPVELKHRKLTRSLHRALVDRHLQPDSQERRQIEVSLTSVSRATHAHRLRALCPLPSALYSMRCSLGSFESLAEWRDGDTVVGVMCVGRHC